MASLRCPPEYTPQLIDQVRQNLKQMGLLEENDPEALARIAMQWQEWSVTAANLAKNRIPTLALIGSRDPFLTDTQNLLEQMSALRIVTLDADHGTLTHKTAFTDRLLDFLAKSSSEHS